LLKIARILRDIRKGYTVYFEASDRPAWGRGRSLRRPIAYIAHMSEDLQPLPTIALGRYRHYKGGRYEVLGVVRHSESLEPMVLYRPLDKAVGMWVRPYAMFLETVVHDGRTQLRFTPESSSDA